MFASIIIHSVKKCIKLVLQEFFFFLDFRFLIKFCLLLSEKKKVKPFQVYNNLGGKIIR